MTQPPQIQTQIKNPRLTLYAFHQKRDQNMDELWTNFEFAAKKLNLP